MRLELRLPTLCERAQPIGTRVILGRAPRSLNPSFLLLFLFTVVLE
ncbi:MAG: hypothetical protein M3R26_01420 [Actinomycetota bacterium]|nr:hypothetical protein [Actinomycetota bacterium]